MSDDLHTRGLGCTMTGSQTDDDDERYGSILDHLKEGFQVIGPDFRYLFVNKAVIEHGRTTPAKLLGRKMWEVYPGIEKTPLFAVLERCMAQRDSVEFENAFTFPDGQTGWFELRIEPVPEGLAILSVDITERKRLEAALAASRRMLQEVTYAAAHDLQTPLRQVLFHTDPDDTQTGGIEAMCRAHEAAQAMHARLAALVAYTEADRSEPMRQVRVETLLGSTLVGVQRRVAALGGRMTTRLHDGPIIVSPKPLLVAARAFLRNALAFRRPDRAPSIELSVALEGDRCVLTVSDAGIGIPAEHLARVWQAFYRVNEVEHAGDGVGLAITRVAVEGVGGEVEARSSRPGGATFVARLPATRAVSGGA